LNNALPSHPDEAREEVILRGEVPSASIRRRAAGSTRAARRRCRSCGEIEPALREQGAGHQVACHLYGS
jgi:hypothetical protein